MNNAIREAYKSLVKNIGRTILTSLGIIIGIASVTLIISSGEAFEQFILAELANYGDDWINVEVKVPADATAAGTRIETFTLDDADAIIELPSIRRGYSGVLGQHIMSYDGKIKRLTTFGVSEDYDVIDQQELTAGRFFTREENRAAEKVAIIGSKVKERFFLNEDPIGKRLKISNKSFRVIGVYEERGSITPFLDYDNAAFIPIRTEQRLLQGIDHISFMVAEVYDNTRIKETAQEVTLLMRDRHDIDDPEDDDFRVTTVDETIELVGTVVQGVQILLIAIAAISLIVGGVGIMNVMYVAVAERTFEIGLRKSVGAFNKDILRQFITESVFITLSGGIIGIIMSYLLAALARYILNVYNVGLDIRITGMAIIISTVFSITVGLIFGIYPARKAARLDPITALRKDK